MSHSWLEAGADFQLPFMGAASRVLKGERGIICPKCGLAELRGYYHLFDQKQGTGTVWVWCPSCRTTAHLPRVQPKVPVSNDPYAELEIEDFAKLETGSDELLLDKLNRLWDEKQLGFIGDE